MDNTWQEGRTNQTGSYAITTFVQSFVCSDTALSWASTTSIVLLPSRCLYPISFGVRVSIGGAAYLQGLSHAENNLQTSVQSRLRFARDELNHGNMVSFTAKKKFRRNMIISSNLTKSILQAALSGKRKLTESSSLKITLRSLCPANVQEMPLSFNCSALISPVNAPLDLLKTFWAATSIPLRRCSRARSRNMLGGAMTTSLWYLVVLKSHTMPGLYGLVGSEIYRF